MVLGLLDIFGMGITSCKNLLEINKGDELRGKKTPLIFRTIYMSAPASYIFQVTPAVGMVT